MWSIGTSLHFKTHSLLSKKNRSVETTAANNGQKKKTGAKITRKMQMDKTGVNGADPAENQTPSYSAEVNSKEMKWTPGHIHAYIIQCKLCLPRETELAAYKYIDIALRKHVEVT